MQKIVDVDEQFKLAVAATETEGMFRHLLRRDLVPEALSEGKVVLLGDAWHVMTYFRA